MRRVSSAPNLKGSSPIGSPMIKSTSNTSLSAYNPDISIELATHAPINSLSKCVITYGFPDQVLKDRETTKDFVACVMTPEEDDKRDTTCPIEDKRFERVAGIVRRQKKKK